MGWITQYKSFADIWMPVAPRGVLEDEFATVIDSLKEQQQSLSMKEKNAHKLLHFEKTIAALSENLRKRALNYTQERLKDIATSPVTDVANDYVRFLKQKEFAQSALKEASLMLSVIRKNLKLTNIIDRFIQTKPFSISNLKKYRGKFIEQGVKFISRNKFTFPRGNIFSKAAALVGLMVATIVMMTSINIKQNLKA